MLFRSGRGEDLDPESKLPHLAHAICCFLMLLESQLNEYGTDDRWTSQQKENNQ